VIEEFVLNNAQHSYLIVFLAVFIDSLPLGGLLVPEEIVMALGGFLASQTNISLVYLCIASSSGLLIGQIALYILGNKYGKALLNFMRISGKKQDKLKDYLDRNSFIVNIMLRFSSTLRSVVAISTGMNNYSFKRFISIEIFFSILRGTGYVLVGYIIGGSIDIIDSFVSQLGVFLLIIVVISLTISLYTSRELFKD
jgi:membrane protein DedA with SNARE-associated domain